MATRAARFLRCAVPVWLATCAVPACSGRQDVLVSKLQGRGTVRTYPVAPDQAWTISRTLLKLEGTDGVEEHRDEGYLLTAQHAEGLSAGTYLGIFVERDAPARTRVTVVARRRSPVQAYPALSERGFHDKFAELLAMAAAVAPSPSCARLNVDTPPGEPTPSPSAAPAAGASPAVTVPPAPAPSAPAGPAAAPAETSPK